MVTHLAEYRESTQNKTIGNRGNTKVFIDIHPSSRSWYHCLFTLLNPKLRHTSKLLLTIIVTFLEERYAKKIHINKTINFSFSNLLNRHEDEVRKYRGRQVASFGFET